ncbi:MAG: hypothetical protein LBG88_03680 [Christensenellaceae bacterium]|jgi:hypothetical protein|nr:hypothetical protein [Christensenellaceae bacterium]
MYYEFDKKRGIDVLVTCGCGEFDALANNARGAMMNANRKYNGNNNETAMHDLEILKAKRLAKRVETLEKHIKGCWVCQNNGASVGEVDLHNL